MAESHRERMANGRGTRTAPHYFVPAPSNWPMVGMISMILTMFGASMVVNRHSLGWFSSRVGFARWSTCCSAGSRRVARIRDGAYNRKVDMSFRWGMSWFIFSEVMFFGAFFGALFYARVITLPLLGDFDHKVLWPDFIADVAACGPGRHDRAVHEDPSGRCRRSTRIAAVLRSG